MPVRVDSINDFNYMTNRWIVAIAGVFMQVALGAVYAWSVFRIPLTKAHGWSISQVTLVFQMAIFVLGFAAFVGGLWMRRSGPRPVALTAALLYGGGVIAAGMVHGLVPLYLTYGVMGGAGIGFGYIVPIATLVKWFPDKRGLITGLAVAGFGSGALVTAPAATALIASVGIGRTFQILGAAYLAIVFAGGLAMRNPPQGWSPAGYRQLAAGKSGSDFSVRQALGRWQWYGLWLMLFLNTTAGIAIISQASPMAQEISGVSAATAAGLVGLISIANGSGRFLWAWLSDGIGRRAVFLAMYVLQAIVFFLLASAHSFGTLSVLCCVVLLCYGGGFGSMPAFAADYFGSREIAPTYGLMLTAWGFAAAFGPTLVASIREATGRYEGAMRWLAAAMLASAALPLFLRPPKPPKGAEQTPVNAV